MVMKQLKNCWATADAINFLVTMVWSMIRDECNNLVLENEGFVSLFVLRFNVPVNNFSVTSEQENEVLKYNSWSHYYGIYDVHTK